MAKKGHDSWILWIKKRIRNNLNFVALLTGPTGVGKSWNALSMAEKLDPDFDSKEQVAFNFLNLMKIINKFNNVGEDPKGLHKKKIKVCVFDEAQTDVNRRDWQKKANKFLLLLLSTFRHQNIIVLFTTPYEDYIDSASLKLFHAKFECKGWNKKTRRSLVRPKILQYNGKLKKFYEHSLFVITGKKVFKLTQWNVTAPSKKIIDPYEQSKTEFTNALNKKLYKEMMGEMENDGRKPPTEKQKNNAILRARGLTLKEIGEKTGTDISVVKRSLDGLINKGWTIEEFAQKEGEK